MHPLRDYLKLHVVIILWGLTAALGNVIDLSPTQLVLIRSALASLILLALLGNQSRIDRKLAAGLIGNGMLLGLHWVLFFFAVKIANVSVCMVGMATISFWTALLEPMMIRERRFRPIDFVLGLVVIAGVFLIYNAETQFHYGLLVALVAALLACIFSIFNGRFSGRAEDDVIVFYEMLGAAVFCSFALLASSALNWDLASDRWWPSPLEWFWISLLVVGCTIYAYRMYVELLKRLSVFTINFANNLEPVYGILLGALIFGDHQHVSHSFYIGATVIVASVTLQPLLARMEARREGGLAGG